MTPEEEIAELWSDVQALKALTSKLVEVVKELDSSSDHDTDYCMVRDCFRCDIAWGIVY